MADHSRHGHSKPSRGSHQFLDTSLRRNTLSSAGQQKPQRRPRSPTTVQRCFGSEKHCGVDRFEDEYPQKLITSHVSVDTKAPFKNNKSQSTSTGRCDTNNSKKTRNTKENYSREYQGSKEDYRNDRDTLKHKKGKKEISFLKLRTRGDVDTDEESGSDLELKNRNFLHMPKNYERERAQRREEPEGDFGSSRPRSKSPYSTKLTLTGPKLEQNQGDFQGVAKEKRDHIPAVRRQRSNISEDYKQCSPGRERRLAYSPPKLTSSRSTCRSSSPESQSSPIRRILSRSPSPKIRLRTLGSEKTASRSCGVQAKGSKSLGPRRQKEEQLDTEMCGDQIGHLGIVKTASDSRIISDLVMGSPGSRKIENAQFQKTGIVLLSDFSDSDEVHQATKRSLLQPCNKSSKPCPFRRSKSRSRKSVHFGTNTESPSEDTSKKSNCGKAWDSSKERSDKRIRKKKESLSKDSSRKSTCGKAQNSPKEGNDKHIRYKIPSPIFFNSRRCGAQHCSPDRTYWVPSPKFSPERNAPILTGQQNEALRHIWRTPNLTGPVDFEKEISRDSRTLPDTVRGIEEDILSKRSSQGDNVFPPSPPPASPPPPPASSPPPPASSPSPLSTTTMSTPSPMPISTSMPISRPTPNSQLLLQPLPKLESEPTILIEELPDKSNHDLDAQEKKETDLKEKSLKDKVEWMESDTPLPTKELIKSQSLHENPFAHKSTSQVIDTILKMHSSHKSLKDGAVMTTKPIVFPSLVTGPAAGQPLESATPEPSTTKRSSTSSLFRDSGFSLTAQNLLKSHRKPTPGRSPPPGCGPSFSAGPGSLKDVRIRTVSRSPSPKKSVFTTFRTRPDYGGSLSFWSERPSIRGKSASLSKVDGNSKRKRLPGRSPPPGAGIFSPGTTSPRETSRDELVTAEEPELAAPTKVEEDAANPGDAEVASTVIPKLPRPPMDDASVVKEISETERGNRPQSTLEKKLSEKFRSFQVIHDNEETIPKTQTTATQYEPLLSSGEDRKDVRVEKKKRSHSESAAKRHHDRVHEPASLLRIPVVIQKSAPRPGVDPNTEPFLECPGIIGSRRTKNYHSFFIPMDRNEVRPDRQHDEVMRHRSHKRHHSSDSSNRSRSPGSPERDLEKQRGYKEDVKGHKHSSEENRRGSVKFQTPKFYPPLQDDDYECGGKKFKEISHFEDDQVWSEKTYHAKSTHRRRSPSESADSTLPTVSDRGKVEEDSNRSSRGTYRRSELRKVHEDDSPNKRNREDEPYQTSSQNFGTENSQDNLCPRKTSHVSSSKKISEPRESRSSPPIAIRGHKELEILEKLPSVSTEDLSVLQKDRAKRDDRGEQTETRKHCRGRQLKQEINAETVPSSSDLSSVPAKHRKRDKSEKPKPKKEDDVDNREEGHDEDMDYQAEAESQAMKQSEESRDVWSKQKWETTVEEIMKRLAGRSKKKTGGSICSQGGSCKDGGKSCCKGGNSSIKEPRESPPHEIVYVVETPPPPDLERVRTTKSAYAFPKTSAGTSGSVKSIKPKSPLKSVGEYKTSLVIFRNPQKSRLLILKNPPKTNISRRSLLQMLNRQIEKKRKRKKQTENYLIGSVPTNQSEIPRMCPRTAQVTKKTLETFLLETHQQRRPS